MDFKQRFFIRSNTVRDNAKDFIDKLPLPMMEDGKEITKPYVVEIKPITRTLEQNSKLHAMLTDISQQAQFKGRWLSVEQWKLIMVSAHAIASGGKAEMEIGLEGEVINLRESTAQMGVKRLASLIDYIEAWAAEQGVQFRDRQGFYGY
ncbi:NinB protein [Pasteurella langaaensis DSM 22999]|uniref:NinB protein n=1 Tax=Alitibacter langaaensis DSM 22999 TaxID=1122935 RepID=A0A2U0TAA9_9PAST|nr:recombination protein NinB [Pasteurella langaaensis]PVX40555.1 NinB protein [Pasteurella langaaensis DSM 22999]